MANEKQMNTRIQHKIDTSTNWAKATNFKPLEGELIIYSDLKKFKIGDGNSLVGALPFAATSDLEKVIKLGDGNSSLVINEGDANGKYSMAGGTTDKDLITSILGSSLASAFVQVDTPVANGDMSLSFGAGTKANASGAMAFGANTQAGCMGYYFTAVNGNTLTLSTTQNSTSKPTSIDWSSRVTVLGATVSAGDIISVNNGNIYLNCAEITAIDTKNGTITVDKLPFTAKASVDDVSPTDYFVFVIDKAHKGAVPMGFGAFATGYDSKAVGTLAAAFGYGNEAAGTAAFVTGRENVGSFASLAGGYKNEAIGTASFAVGRRNTASGDASSAEGIFTEATAQGAHAEGVGNENSKNTAGGLASHVEGRANKALGHSSHAEGRMTVADGGTDSAQGATHAEGLETQALAVASHSEGYKTEASGKYSHTEGNYTLTTGESSHAEGVYTKATGKGAHAEGMGNNADESANIASGAGAHAEGRVTKATASGAHAEGVFTEATAEGAHAEGKYAKATGVASHASGLNVEARGKAQTVVGQYNVPNEESLFIVGAGESEIDAYNALEVNRDSIKINAGLGDSLDDSGIAITAEAVTLNTKKHLEIGDTDVPGNFLIADAAQLRLHNYHDMYNGGTSSNMTYGNEGIEYKLKYGPDDNDNYKLREMSLNPEDGLRIVKEDDNIGGNAAIVNISTNRLSISKGDYENTAITPNSINFNYDTMSGPTTLSGSEGPDGTSCLYTNGSIKIDGDYYYSNGETIEDRISCNSPGYTATYGEIFNDYVNNNIIKIDGGSTPSFSHVEGTSNKSSGKAGHAEGQYTYAKGDYSHAEGYGNMATPNLAAGIAAHAEGRATNAYGHSSHAEGNMTIAGIEGQEKDYNRVGAHAEGWRTEATGIASHAEGKNTKATGDYSHAAGLDTIAAGEAQTVVGKYNQENSNAVFIVGNGTYFESRNNAFIVDGGFRNSVRLYDEFLANRDEEGMSDVRVYDNKIQLNDYVFNTDLTLNASGEIKYNYKTNHGLDCNYSIGPDGLIFDRSKSLDATYGKVSHILGFLPIDEKSVSTPQWNFEGGPLVADDFVSNSGKSLNNTSQVQFIIWEEND